jgi:hypothetical protein
MSIAVRSIKETFKLEITVEDEKVIFTYRQLNYKLKNLIAGLVTSIRAGNIYVDTGLSCFYHLKYAVKEVQGLTNLDGTPYLLEFESEEKEALSDKCTDELLAGSFSDKIIFASKQLINSIPDKIVNPITGQALEGVEIILEEQAVKKTS